MTPSPPNKPKIIHTDDGSHTIYLPELNETYHSKFGAVNEAQHVFIENGLAKLEKLEIRASVLRQAQQPKISKQESTIEILEIGFGTGLNALLTLLYSIDKELTIKYFTIEKNPLLKETTATLNYPKIIEGAENYFDLLHSSEWEKSNKISDNFILKKMKANVLNKDLKLPENIDIIYFDAFAPSKQPEMWNENLFKKLFTCLKNDGKLVTYSSAGIVKQALRNAGFTVKRLQGPPGKHHMLFCSK
jgi:tRNA U34 5-methylaminomethyl-2-thiouridine-forming methyltransferase MnmC